MGLDTVELVIEVEESFGITIADGDAEAIRTVGDLYRYVLERMAVARDLRERGICPTAHAFHAIRRALAGVMGTEDRSIRPSTAVEAVIGSRHRRAIWERLGSAMALRLPNLRPPAWVAWTVLILPFAVAIGAGIRVWSFVGDVETAATMGILSFLAMLVSMVVLCRWLATRLPDDCVTMAGLAREVARLNFGTVAEQAGCLPSPDEVWEALRTIIVEQLGVRPDEVTEEARIVQDLGAD